MRADGDAVVSTTSTRRPVRPPTTGFGEAITKPLSILRWSLDGRSLVKIYRGLDPHGRQQREAYALRRAASFGLTVPEVIDTGVNDSLGWNILSVVGTGTPIRTVADVSRYVHDVIDVTARLRFCSTNTTGLAPGVGWSGHAAAGNRHYLLAQLSLGARTRPIFDQLHDLLRTYDRTPAVHLHGDLKPEHLLHHGRQIAVIDWESCGRGPAECDHVDAAFHLLRDLVYAGADPRLAPVRALGSLDAPGDLLAWRVALWLDRRRDRDLHLLTSADVRALCAARDSAMACRLTVDLLARLHAAGVPR